MNKVIIKSYKTEVSERNILDISKAESEGIVEMYINGFNNTDLQGDISARGSFDKTIKNDFNFIRHLQDHDTTKLIGIPIEFRTDDYGLIVKSRLNLTKSFVNDIYNDYVFFKTYGGGRTIYHSISGFIIRRNKEKPAIVEEYTLCEYSTLSFWPANFNTQVLSVKSAPDFYEKMYNNSEYSDLRKEELEQAFEFLNKRGIDWNLVIKNLK